MELQKSFIRNTLPAAEKASVATGIPTNVILAQWALESGWGKSGLAKTGNLGGIKEWGRGESVSMPTKEVVGGQKINTVGRFKDFKGDVGAYADSYAKLMSGPRYAQVRAQRDPLKAIEALSRSGYATEKPDIYKKGVTGTYQTIQKILGEQNKNTSKTPASTEPGFSMKAKDIGKTMAKGMSPSSQTPMEDIIPGSDAEQPPNDEISTFLNRLASAKDNEADNELENMFNTYADSLNTPQFSYSTTNYRFPGFFNG